MKHLNPYRFFELASKLYALFSNTSQNRVTEVFAPLTEAQTVLDGWIKGDIYPLETSKHDADRLLNKISSLFNKYYIDQATKQIKTPSGEDRLDPHEVTLVRALVDKFEHSLAAELSHAPIYLAEKRGIYSTYDLIENASACFGPSLRDAIPTLAMKEFDEAGRALAFGMATASGMHLLRAIELVLKRFYETFSGAQVGKNERSYSIYLKKLAALSDEEGVDFKPDKRLLQMLAQIKENYRNPLTVPESGISLDQATSLFALATAAITLMTEQVMAKADRTQNRVQAMEMNLEALEKDEESSEAPLERGAKSKSRK